MNDAELDDFMALGGGAKPGPSCWLCGIPQRDIVERAMAQGRPQADILRALQKLYPEMHLSRHRLKHHFEASHHVR